jgi:hypothetical protein
MEKNFNLKRTEAPPNTFDPIDELPEEDIKKAYEKADAEIDKTNDKVLNLLKSDIQVPGQEWVLVSFVGHNCNQKTEQLGMKVWGTFDNPENAHKHAKVINQSEENKIFDIFVLEMYTWAVIPPDPTCMKDQNYHEEQLHNLITEHKKQQHRAKEVFNIRKDKLKNNPDMNQFNKNKKIFKELMGETETEIVTKTKIQNEEALRAIHGEPLKLPKIKVEPLNQISGAINEKLQEGGKSETFLKLQQKEQKEKEQKEQKEKEQKEQKEKEQKEKEQKEIQEIEEMSSELINEFYNDKFYNK